MTPSGMTTAEQGVYGQAMAIVAELCAPGLSADASIAMLSELVGGKIRSAQSALERAEHQAVNNTLAEPDTPGAERYCGFCGATNPEGGLEDDGLVPLTGERIGDVAWFCKMLAACIARRRRRFPNGDTARERAALERAKEAAQPAILALAAVAVCMRAAGSTAALLAQAAVPAPVGTLALSAPDSAAQSRPGRPSREQYQAARWAHTMSGNPANRAWTEGARRARLSRPR